MESCEWVAESYHEWQGGILDSRTVIILIAGILLLGLIWRVIKGAIRFVLIIGVVLVLVYIVLSVLR